MKLHMDYETASDLNLKQVGGYRYARDPSTRALMLSWAVDDDPVHIWEPHLHPRPPSDLLYCLQDPAVEKHAYNAQFERLITRYCLGVDVPYEQWRCTMVASYYLGFAGTLDNVLKAIGLPAKDQRGGRLINMFCSPAPKNHKADWYNWENRPAEWEEFKQYCIQDTVVERQLSKWLARFPLMRDWDWQQWFLDQKINDRGVPMDVGMARAAIDLWEDERKNLTEEMAEITGLPKVTRDPFIGWVREHTGVFLENTQKDYLASLLKRGDLPEQAGHVVNLWAQKEAKATSKYTAVVNATAEDGRARGMFQYKGASRTDRVGGRVIQLQNLKKPLRDPSKDPEHIARISYLIKTRDPLLLKLWYPESVSEILGGSIRHVIEAGPGKQLAICDLTSIESVILGWISNCLSIDQTFRAGEDTYKKFAAEYFGVPYHEVTREQRTFSKPPVLGCGFMLGWRGLIAYAEGYGVDLDEEQAKSAVYTFRNMYPEIPQFWDWISSAAKYVIQSGVSCSGYRMHLERDSDFLRIWLPSGRALSYYLPEVRTMEAPWSTEERPAFIDNVTYMGMNDKNQWVRIAAHAGGLTENIVQSIAGDVLWNGITNADAAGVQVILHVHDEIGAEEEEYRADWALQQLKYSMTSQPSWCADMWLGAAGFLTKRYTKD